MGWLDRIMRAFGEMNFFSEPADLGIPSYEPGELIPCYNDGDVLVIDTTYHPDMGWRYDVLRKGVLYRGVQESVLEEEVRS
jgi:hypothetical protein